MIAEVTVSTEPSAQAFERWADTFRRYLAESGKRVDDVLRKKGRDLGIRLYQGFDAHKWGGAGKHPGIAVAEQQTRRASGEGTKVRDKLMEMFRSARSDLNFDVRSAGQRLRRANTSGTLDDWSAATANRRRKRELRAALWQKIVKAELGIRQSSIGFQAAAFLMFRKKNGPVEDERATNRKGDTIGSVRTQDGTMEIVSYATFSADTARKHGIIDAALNASADDMLTYVHRKELEGLMGTGAR